MADATITIGADATQAKATLEQLKQITDELFKGLAVAPEKAAAAQDQLIKLMQSFNLTTLEANNAAARLRPELEGMAKGGDAAAFSMKGLTKSFLGTISVVALLRANFDDLKPSLEAAGSEFRRLVGDMGLSKDSANVLANSFEMLVNPFSIIENMTENLRIASRQLVEQFYDETGATNNLTDAQNERVKALALTLKAQQELTRAQDKDSARESALIRQIQLERQQGDVAKENLTKLKSLMDEYERAGQSVPPEIAKIAAELRVLSSEQERAAKEAERLAEKERKEIEKSAEAYRKAFDAVKTFALDKKNAASAVEVLSAALSIEAGAVGESGKSLDAYTEKLEKLISGKQRQKAATDETTKAIKEEIAALQKVADAANKAAGDAQESLKDAQARRAELEGKPILSVEESEELLDLQTKTSQLQADAANTAEDAAQKTFEYGEAQSELAGATEEAGGALDSFADSGDYVAQVNRELEQSSAQLGKAMSDLGQDAASANEIVETIGENGERKFSNVTEAAGEFGDVLVQVGEDGQYVMESIERGTEGVAQAAPAAADGVAQLGDELRNLPADDDETGIGKSRSDLEAMVNTLLPRALELGKELRDVLGSVTLGGGSGAGI